jgi:prevent-host-death family protein
MWSVQEAKSKLSEVLRLARAGEPQTIGMHEPCVVVSAATLSASALPLHLGRFLVDSAPRGAAMKLPTRASRRGNPFDEGAE